MSSSVGNENGVYMEDGFSQTRPPRFEGVNYGYWRNWMELFIGSTDPDWSNIVLDGPLEVKEARGKWSEQDKKNFQLNSKATNMMYSALGPEEYHRVTGCKSAKEIWDKLRIAHEGTSHVKISKINSLKQEFESFVMKPDETIKEMNDRFMNIVNSLRNMEVDYPSDDLVRKILWALPKRWTPKVTAIEESKDLTKLSLDELMESLVTHEEKLRREEGEDPRREKKGIAFKAISHGDELEDEELALLRKHVAKLLRLRKERRRGAMDKKSKDGDGEKDQPKYSIKNGRKNNADRTPTQGGCFKCGRAGHIKAECPQLKKERAYAATWSCSEEEEEESYTNYKQEAYMAIDNSEDESDAPKVTSSNYYSDYYSENDHMIETIREIQLELGNVKNRYSKLKRDHLELQENYKKTVR
ncbi:unnamed protein product [Linum trigynum]|uniref:CCHC-type domain-containing protein n=1 Tax=Linum trigynum TaxID=586398 RepID=A0AAV2EAX2_9ROSI